jgi:hypothetical protein
MEKALLTSIKKTVGTKVTPHDARIFIMDYMTIKRDHLHPSYFKSDDALAISNWSDTRVEQVYEKLIEYIGDEDNSDSLLRYRACPFCIDVNITYEFTKCSDCSYGKIHGYCHNDDSDYQKNVCHSSYSKNSLWADVSDRMKTIGFPVVLKAYVKTRDDLLRVFGKHNARISGSGTIPSQDVFADSFVPEMWDYCGQKLDKIKFKGFNWDEQWIEWK